MSARPQIIYFDIRGRAEPIRLMLEEVGVEYDDIQITDAQWPELKPKTPFGELPLFREGDVELAQSHAIYRHLARTHELYGEDEDQRVRCDMVVEALRDAKDHLGFAFWRPKFAEQRRSFVEQELPRRLDALARFFAANPAGTVFWSGNSLSLADVVAFSYLDDVEALFPGSLSGRHELNAFCKLFAERPGIAAYLQSSRRPAAIQYGPAGRIYPARDGGPRPAVV